ncbi:MAG TPA: type I-U CRISPR-associated protein Cas8c [Stellaceae bacterium]
MSDASIPVDLRNPGQVFACLGFLEAADILLGDAEGGFDWHDEAAVTFQLRATGDENPVTAVLAFLAKAKVSSVAPHGSTNRTEKWHVQTTHLLKDAPFPFPDPPSPATLPAVIGTAPKTSLTIDHWGDATSRDNVKFWAGSGGYPGAALTQDALDLVRGEMIEAADDPFALSASQSSSFRFDWRRDYIPMDIGFSPNDHGELTMVGFPLVEIFAALGLGNARPERIDKLNYRYGVIGNSSPDALFPPIYLRAALGGADLPFSQRRFRMRLGWPGQENQARCITEVFEES